MAEKKESKFKWLDSAQKIVYMIVAVLSLLILCFTGLFATYSKSLLGPLNHTQKYFDRELNELVIKVNKMDDEVDNNRHDIAIIKSHMQRIK